MEETPAPPSRPPDSVAHVARTHWLVGAVVVVSFLVLHALTRNLPRVDINPLAPRIVLGLGLLYLATGTMVWFGMPFGRFCSQVCGLLHLARPQLGDRIWRIMRSAEFKTHFGRKPPGDGSV